MISTLTGPGRTEVVRNAIYSAASATGVDFSYLLNQARVESSLNPDARARTSSATGLYQFVEQSWLGVVARHGETHGLGWAASEIQRGSDGRYRVADPELRSAILDLRRDPGVSAAMAAEFASDNRATLEARLGRSVASVDLYLAHFLGAAGATKFLKAHETTPERGAADLFPAAARSNRAVFFRSDGTPRSLSDVRSRFAAKFDGTTAPQPHWQHPLQFASAPPQAPPLTAQARLAYLMLASLGVSA